MSFKKISKNLSLSLSSHVKGQSIGIGRLEIWYFSGTDAKQ